MCSPMGWLVRLGFGWFGVLIEKPVHGRGNMVTRLTPILLLSMALSSCATHRLPKPVARIVRAPVPSFEHVFVVVDANHYYVDVISNNNDMPFHNHIAPRYSHAP